MILGMTRWTRGGADRRLWVLMLAGERHLVLEEMLLSETGLHDSAGVRLGERRMWVVVARHHAGLA